MKILSKVKTKILGGCILTSGLISSSVFAAEPAASSIDLSPLTDSVDFAGILTAIMAIAASLIVLYAGYAGVRWVLRMVKGA